MPFKLDNYVSERPFSDEKDAYGHCLKVGKILFEGNSKFQKMLVINNSKFGNASNTTDIRKINPQELEKRGRERGVKELKYYAPAFYPNMYEVTNQIRAIIEENEKISTDKDPLDAGADFSTDPIKTKSLKIPAIMAGQPDIGSVA